MFAKPRILHLCMFVALVIMVIFMTGAEAAQPQILPAQSKEDSEMLQFTSPGHVLGFLASGAYVATGTHMLRERFAGTKGTAPRADRPSAKKGRAQSLGRVCYPHLWDGITLIYDSPPGGILRSTFQVGPWADPGQIGLCYNVPIHLDASNNLVFELETGNMTASAPVAWQEIDGERMPVDVAFRLNNSQSTVHFSLGHYNPAFPLTIDPTLSWNTFMGSPDVDIGKAIAVDGSGNVYVAGSGATTWGSPVNAHAGGGENDAFAAKLNSTGVLQWNTFMGSSSSDAGKAIAVDGSGNVYVAGISYDTWGSPINAHAGGAERDAFVAKLDSSGVTVWNTFMGSADADIGNAIAVDGSGNVYVAGISYDTWGSPVNAYAGNHDAFVAKLNSSGVSVWNTFMGSSSGDYGHAIAVHESGNVYVAGYSYASWGNPVGSHTGGWTDAFAAKLDSGGELQWNTFMGSSGWDEGYTIAIDEGQNVYVAGYSDTTWGSPVNAFSGDQDAFAAKIDSSGVSVWNTFMGSSEYERGYAIAVDERGNVYVGGNGNATWGRPVNAYVGGYDAFVVKLKNNGERQWNTFMGSSSYDIGYGIAVDGKGNVYVAGESTATWGSPVNPYVGDEEAFAAKILKGALTPGIPLLLMDSLNE